MIIRYYNNIIIIITIIKTRLQNNNHYKVLQKVLARSKLLKLFPSLSFFLSCSLFFILLINCFNKSQQDYQYYLKNNKGTLSTVTKKRKGKQMKCDTLRIIIIWWLFYHGIFLNSMLLHLKIPYKLMIIKLYFGLYALSFFSKKEQRKGKKWPKDYNRQHNDPSIEWIFFISQGKYCTMFAFR